MLPPNENEEAYFEGRDDGREDKENERKKNLAEKYGGEKQRWYIQGYNDSYNTERPRNWIVQTNTDEHGSGFRLSSADKRELIQLRRDKRRLEMENEILKRAAAYFARESVLPN